MQICRTLAKKPIFIDRYTQKKKNGVETAMIRMNLPKHLGGGG